MYFWYLKPEETFVDKQDIEFYSLIGQLSLEKITPQGLSWHICEWG